MSGTPRRFHFAAHGLLVAAILSAGLSCGGDDHWDDRDHWDDSGGRAVVAGSATFRERIALPRDAQLYVELLRVAPNGRPIDVVAARRVWARGLPIRFQIPFDADRIDPASRYAVRGELRTDERVWFQTAGIQPVVIRGNSSRADLLLVPAGGHPGPGPGPAPGPELRGRIDGEAIFRERVLLPRDARLRVELIELNGSRPGRVIAQEDVSARGSPIRYRLSYDRGRIDPRQRYAVRARVVADGRVRFVSADVYGVLTHGSPEFANIYLVAGR